MDLLEDLKMSLFNVTLIFNQYKNFDKAPFVIYTDLECLIEKIDGCKK